MLISHEIPKALFPFHEDINGYPYLLAHLLSEKYNLDKEYASFYKKVASDSALSYLDNSCYELGYPIDTPTLVDIGNEYQVSHIVIPDAYKDLRNTIKLAEENIPLIVGKTKARLFAVLQGRSIEEMFLCYDFFASIDAVDVIGINFTTLEESDNASRGDFFELLLQNRIVEKKIHFLGVQSPYEILRYTPEQKSRIFSIDTSNPVITGWSGYRYKDDIDINYTKPREKLADNLNKELSVDQLDDIFYNINKFKEFVES